MSSLRLQMAEAMSDGSSKARMGKSVKKIHFDRCQASSLLISNILLTLDRFLKRWYTDPIVEFFGQLHSVSI